MAVEPVPQSAEARHFLAHPESPEFHLEEVNWVVGQAFTVWVRRSGTSRSGHKLLYRHYQALIVSIDYADGTNRLFSVRFPTGGPSAVSVLVP